MAEYIEREALQKFPIRANHCDKAHADENFIFGIEAVLEYAEHIPTADVAPVRHGKWEQFRLGTDDYALRLRCSCCRKVVYERGFGYCPNCGARMDLGGTENA